VLAASEEGGPNFFTQVIPDEKFAKAASDDCMIGSAEFIPNFCFPKGVQMGWGKNSMSWWKFCSELSSPYNLRQFQKSMALSS
jgi:hypothetical protein